MDSKDFSASIAKFSAKFCDELEKKGSIVASPLSAEYVLALVALGADDPAHAEILQSLGIPGDEAIRSSFSNASARLKSISGITLNVANKVYVQDGGYKLNSGLENDAVKVFDAAVEKIDFGGSAAAQTINKWVESKTNERIKDLLSSDSVNSDTRLVLVNALYFKGTWLKQFERMSTMDQPFHLDESQTVDVPMMFIEDSFLYGTSEDLGVQYLRMQYEGREASMLIILPKEINGLERVLKQLAGGYDLMADLDDMHERKVRVTIPKFKIESEIDMSEVLPKLGIKAIFDRNNSGLTKMLDNGEPLYVSKALQKAFIEVNEEGAEAAAASGMVMMMRCAPRPAPTFRADRPFVYALMDNARTTLFIGAYRGPN